MTFKPNRKSQRGVRSVDTPFPFSRTRLILTTLSKVILKEEFDRYEQLIDRYFTGETEPDTADFVSSYQGAALEEIIARRQVSAFFTKNASLPSCSDSVREKRAFEKWLEAEEQCKRTNRRFSTHPIALNTMFTAAEAELVRAVRRKINRVLGRVPPVRSLDFRFGPGASVGVSRSTTPRHKFSADPTISANAFIHLKWLKEEHPHWDLGQPKVTRGRLTFVPKDAAKFRSIVVEPIVNTYLQLGAGSYIRSRLKKFGIDLTNQQTNRDLARLGSLTGIVSTIDLSSASDTISRDVVMSLLPHDWYTLLDSMRTRTVEYNGVAFSQEKFSSMGNGYTFELESLIFYAITEAVCGESGFISVYGDDIICPTRHFHALVEALQLFGFTPNEKKSFHEGPFRESCGKDFLGGVDVRPCYIKDHLDVLGLFRLHNFFKRRGANDIAATVLRYIPARFRIYGPDREGDGHLIGDWRLHGRKSKNPGWQGYHYKTYAATRRLDTEEKSGDFCAVLYEQHRRPYHPLRPREATDSFHVIRGKGRALLRRVYTWSRPSEDGFDLG